MLPSPILIDTEAANWLLREGEGNIRAALICWGMVLGAFVILRIPREVLLGCLLAAGATIGLAATVVEVTPERATAASLRASEVAAAREQTARPPRRDAATEPPESKRPY